MPPSGYAVAAKTITNGTKMSAVKFLAHEGHARPYCSRRRLLVVAVLLLSNVLLLFF
jgi:hypothetical protein